MRVSVIIPTHNEAQSIERVLADLPRDLTTEVIVADSNSRDGTPEIAARMGPASFRNRAAAMGERALPGSPWQVPLTWLCFLMATIAIGPRNYRFS